MTLEQEERLVAAFESIGESFDFIAGTLETMSHTLQAHHEKTFPTRKPPVDATISHILTEEERLREDQGASDEPIDQWTRLGPREEAYLREHPESDANREAKEKK